MKTRNLIAALIAPVLLVACDSEKSEERMKVGAQKIEEGLKKMAEVAGERAEETLEDARKESKKLLDEASEKLEPKAPEPE